MKYLFLVAITLLVLSSSVQTNAFTLEKLSIEEYKIEIARLKQIDTKELQKKKEEKPSTYSGLIDFYCNQYGCNPTQLKRVMRCESTNNPNARNGIHSGLFQFNPNTFSSYARKVQLLNPDIWNPEDQIQVASYMFANGQARQWSCK